MAMRNGSIRPLTMLLGTSQAQTYGGMIGIRTSSFPRAARISPLVATWFRKNELATFEVVWNWSEKNAASFRAINPPRKRGRPRMSQDAREPPSDVVEPGHDEDIETDVYDEQEEPGIGE